MSRVTLSEKTPCPVCGCQGKEAELARERDLAVAHDRQPYPTAEAYERVCALLEERKDEAARLRAILQSCESVGVELTWYPGRIQATARNARADALGEKYRALEARATQAEARATLLAQHVTTLLRLTPAAGGSAWWQAIEAAKDAVDGANAPPESDLARNLERAESDARRLRMALEVAETHIADDTCRHDYEKAPALHAIRAALAGKEGP